MIEVILVAVFVGLVGRVLLERMMPSFAKQASVIAITAGLVLGAGGGLDGETLRSTLVAGLALVGLFAGLRLRFPRSAQAWVQSGRPALVMTAIALPPVVTGVYVAMIAFGGSAPEMAFVAAVGFGAVAVAGGSLSLDRADGGVLATSRLLDGLSLLLVGMLFCALAPATGPLGALSTTEWVVASLVVGAAVGLLGALMVGGRSETARATALVGVALLAGGVAHWLHLSPLFLGLLAGIVLANRGPESEAQALAVEHLVRPTHLLVVVLAAAVWTLPDQPMWALPAGFAVVQLLLKLSGSAFAWRAGGSEDLPAGGAPGAVALAQGGVPIAAALSVWHLLGGADAWAGNTLVLGALMAVVLNELVAAMSIERQASLPLQNRETRQPPPLPTDGQPGGELSPGGEVAP